MGEHRTVAADGIELFSRSWGRPGGRTPVLCIPGLTRNSRDFTSVAHELADERFVVAVDLRGRGRSQWDPSARSYSLDTYADDVVAVLEDVVGEPAVLLGTSLGGLTSMWVAADRPDLVRAVVLNDIGPEIDPEGAARIAAYAGRLPPPGTWDEAVAQTRAVSEPATPGLTDDEWRVAAEQRYREEPDGTVVVDHDPGITSGPGPARDPWLVFSALGALPVTVLRGATSDVLAASTVAAMAENHPGLVAVEVPDRGHTPTLDEPVVRDALRRALAAVDDRAG